MKYETTENDKESVNKFQERKLKEPATTAQVQAEYDVPLNRKPGDPNIQVQPTREHNMPTGEILNK